MRAPLHPEVPFGAPIRFANCVRCACLWRVPDGQFGTAEQTVRLGAAEVADEQREVGLDPGDVGPKACLAQPTQLLGSRARFVVFPIDGCQSVGGIFGDDDVADDEASAGHDDARDTTEQISLGRPVEVVDGQRGDHQVKWSLRKWIFESSGVEIRVGKRSTGVLEHGRAFVDAHQSRAWVLSQYSLRGDSRSDTQVQNRPCTQASRRLGDDLLEAVVGGHLAPHELEIRLRMEVKLVAHALPTVPRRSHPRSADPCASRPVVARRYVLALSAAVTHASTAKSRHVPGTPLRSCSGHVSSLWRSSSQWLLAISRGR